MFLVTYFIMYKAKISKSLRVNMQCTFIERKSKVTAITKNRNNFKRQRRFED